MILPRLPSATFISPSQTLDWTLERNGQSDQLH